ncbi:MAG: Crp/Fnr family transcriptional regulator [Gammaproteobacteria bacterium]|nr:Crp/Fnr family transcriptional regulator [Gammaproteobacteria bacterium]
MTKTEKILLSLFASMDAVAQTSLIEYAEFLAARHPAKQTPAAPLEIERPAEESVVAAIKRLSHTYPMLDRQALLHETSSFMMQYMMQGREAVEVIDEMEIYFQRQYEQFSLRGQDDSDA